MWCVEYNNTIYFICSAPTVHPERVRGRSSGGGGGGGGKSKHGEVSKFPPSLPTEVAEEEECAYEPARFSTSPATRDRTMWLWVKCLH